MKETIYFFNAHPDDLIGSAGVALRLANTGRYALEVIDLTRGERGLAAAGVPMAECAKLRAAEEEQACALLGVKPRFLGEIDGEAFASRETCRAAAELFRAAPPRAVFTHWPVDRHPDHTICYAVVIRALELAGITSELYCFEESIQTTSMPIRHYVVLDAAVMARKLDLIRCYACQNPNDEMAERKWTEARYHGWKAGCEFAECYGSPTPPLGRRTLLDELFTP